MYAAPDEDLDGPVLGLFEGGHGGGRLVSRSLAPVELLCEIADILQHELAEQPADGASRDLRAHTIRTPHDPVGTPAKPGGGAHSSTSACTDWVSEKSRPQRTLDCLKIPVALGWL